MYLVRDSFRVSLKCVVIINTKQEAAHTQSAKVSTCYTLWHFGDWSLANYGEGGLQNGRVETRGERKVLAVLKGGGGGVATNSFEVVLTWELEVLAIVMRGCVQKVSSL